MANIKANIKSIRKDKKRTQRNKIVLSGLKTQIKKTRANCTAATVSISYKSLDSAASKGKISKNKARRLKSKLARNLNKAGK
jgi:small subunit ribosomal protein S20